MIAICISIAQADDPKYDDDNRCNTSDASLAPGIYVLTDMCEQTGYVCKLASESTGTVIFLLGTSADCNKFHTTKMTTYYPIKNQPSSLDYNHPNNELRLTLLPDGVDANMFGVPLWHRNLFLQKVIGLKSV